MGARTPEKIIVLSRLGIEASPLVNYLIAFVVIFAVLALAALAIRRFTGDRLAMNGQDRNRARQPRLGIVDVYDLDRQRQLILLRRDNVEHLLLIGGPNDVVIETNIVRVAGARLPAPAEPAVPERGEPMPDRIEAPAARPALDPVRSPEPALREPARATGAAPDSGAEARPANRARPAAPATRIEPALKPEAGGPAPADAAAAGPQGAKEPERPASTAAPAPRRAPQPPPAARLRPIEAEPQPTPRPIAPAPQPQPVQGGPDAAVLSDMAIQLEEALRQPRAAGRSPGAGARARPEPSAQHAPAPGPPPRASPPPSAPLPSPEPVPATPASRPA